MGYPGSEKTPTAYRAPLYPSFLVFFNSPGKARYAQLAVYPVLALGIYLWAAVSAGSGAGLAAVSVYALNSYAVDSAASLGIEFFYSLILFLALFSLYAASMKHKKFFFLFACALFGVSLSVRSPAFLFFPILLFLAKGYAPAAGRRLFYFSVLALFFLPVLPWTLRNVVHFRAFVPFERHSSVCNFYIASADIKEDILPEEAWERAFAGNPAAETLSAPEKDEALFRMAVKNIADRPFRYLRGIFSRLWKIFGFFPLLFGFFLSGFLIRPLRSSWGFKGPAFFILYFALIHSFFAVERRYFYPLLPALAVLASIPPFFLLGQAGKKFKVLFEKAEAVKLEIWVFSGSLFFISLWFFSSLLLAKEILKTGFSFQDECADMRETVLPDSGRKDEVYYNSSGVLAFISGRTDEAEADFRRALLINPDYADPALSLAAILEKKGKKAEALDICRGLEKRFAGHELKREERTMAYSASECVKRNLRAR